MWNLKTKQMKKQTKSRITPINTENKLMVALGKGNGGMGKMCEGEWEIQASRYGMNTSWEQKVQCREYSQ